MLAKDVN